MKEDRRKAKGKQIGRKQLLNLEAKSTNNLDLFKQWTRHPGTYVYTYIGPACTLAADPSCRLQGVSTRGEAYASLGGSSPLELSERLCFLMEKNDW